MMPANPRTCAQAHHTTCSSLTHCLYNPSPEGHWRVWVIWLMSCPFLAVFCNKCYMFLRHNAVSIDFTTLSGLNLAQWQYAVFPEARFLRVCSYTCDLFYRTKTHRSGYKLSENPEWDQWMVSMLISWLCYYSFAQSYHWETGPSYRSPFCIISGKCIWIYNY